LMLLLFVVSIVVLVLLASAVLSAVGGVSRVVTPVD